MLTGQTFHRLTIICREPGCGRSFEHEGYGRAPLRCPPCRARVRKLQMSRQYRRQHEATACNMPEPTWEETWGCGAYTVAMRKTAGVWRQIVVG